MLYGILITSNVFVLIVMLPSIARREQGQRLMAIDLMMKATLFMLEKIKNQ
jgi:hypothetical protein